MIRKISFFVMTLIAISVVWSCGYTTRSALPPRLQAIHVENFKNNIDFTRANQRNVYLPLLEVQVREAVVDRYLFDGNLNISEPEDADLILTGSLQSYRRDPLRYTDDDDVLEYRVNVIMDLELVDTRYDKPMWTENGFAGEATYFVSGSQAGSESAAVEEAIQDLARRIVERTIENW